MSAPSSFPPKITTFPAKTFDSLALDLWSGAQLSDDQLRALAVGAWYAHNWIAYHDTLALLPERTDIDTTRKEETIDSLHTWWDITSGEQALDTIGRLHRGMHAPTYAVVHPLVVEAFNTPDPTNLGELPSQHMEMLRSLASFRGYEDPNALAHAYEGWLQAMRLKATNTIPLPLPADIVAWDLVRSVFVTRAAFTAGYIEEDVAWEQLMAGLEIAQRHYQNWRQFGASYIAGAVFWQSNRDLSSAKQMGDRRRQANLRLWERPLSPWRRVALHPDGPVAGLTPHHTLPTP